MVNQLKKILNQFREFWSRQERKRKILICSILGGVILVSILATILLNGKKSEYVTLYKGLAASESMQIYDMLRGMSVPVQIDASGNLLVRERDKDRLLLELSALGYPKTAPSYDIFTSNAGLTTTEFEMKQYLIFQLQDRIEKTIMNIEGVSNAIVTLVIPEESSYVWEEDSDKKSTASVLITMKDGAVLSSNRISAIKNLIASSVPKMNPEDVTIVDALTSLELRSAGEDGEEEYSSKRLDFETQMEQKIVEKAKNVLSLGYSENEMRVSATVVIDYSKMITEEMEYVPGEDGKGIPSHFSESYEMDASDLASGIPGEESNTDVPIYVDSDDDGIPETVYHVRDIEYFVSYVKQQIEKDNTQLVDASVAISLKDGALTERKRQNIISLVSDATNVPETNITVVDLLVPEPATPTPSSEPVGEEKETTGLLSMISRYLPYIIIAGSVLFVLLIGMILFIVLRRRRKEKKKTEAELVEEEIKQRMLEEEEAQRKKLREAALASVSRDNKATEEVKEFAYENPEITASLIRAWLKEGE